MVGWVRERRTIARGTAVLVEGFPLVAVEPGWGLARLLARRRVTRTLLPLRAGLPAVDPLPLCRALAPRLALDLLDRLPLRERRVLVRSERPAPWVRALCAALAPRVGELALDLDTGGEDLAGELWESFGLGVLPSRGLPSPALTVAFSPVGSCSGPVLRLWGEPDLLGISPRLGRPLPAGLPELPFLTLLWEAGRLKPEDILLNSP